MAPKQRNPLTAPLTLAAATIIGLAVGRGTTEPWLEPRPVQIANTESRSRSPEWPKVRAAHLKKHPECIACGFKSPSNQVHHADVPFHIDQSRELDPNNLETLCGAEHWNCHFRIGHLGNFKCWNPNVREDAAYFRKRLESRLCDLERRK